MSPAPPESRHLPQRVVIVGAGLAGALVAANLLRSGAEVDVTLVDRSGAFGLGVAYATADPQHLMNVPAAKLSVWPDDPAHLLAWAQAEDPTVEGGTFIPRQQFGRYVQHVLETAERHASRGRLNRISGAVARIETDGTAELVVLADGTRLTANAVVLAIGAQPGQLPPGFPDDPRVFATPWEPGATAALGSGTALLIGTGLTAVDAALSLSAADPTATIVALSRGGHLPFAHLADPLRTPAAPPTWPDPLTADAMAGAFAAHANAVDAAPDGDWRDAVDGLRSTTQELWRSLPLDEQRRFIREHSRAWEVRRHRMATGVAIRLRALRERGRFQVLAGTVQSVTALPTALNVHYIRADDGAEATISGQRVISCVGPEPDIRRATSPILRQLLADGRASTDPLRLGLRAAADGRLIDEAGTPQPRIFTLGLLRRGELWETTAVPEIRAQAAQIAGALTAS